MREVDARRQFSSYDNNIDTPTTNALTISESKVNIMPRHTSPEFTVYKFTYLSTD